MSVKPPDISQHLRWNIYQQTESLITMSLITMRLQTCLLLHVYKHLQNSDKCQNLSTEKNFIILDSVSTVFQLKIKEALYIQWQQPSLNEQVCHVNLSLFM